MALSPSGAFVVVIRKILTLLSVVENAPPNCASGRNANPVISSGEDPNSLALYTCLYLCEAKAGGPMSKGKMLLPLPSTLVFDTIVTAVALELHPKASSTAMPTIKRRFITVTVDLAQMLYFIPELPQILAKPWPHLGNGV